MIAARGGSRSRLHLLRSGTLVLGGRLLQLATGALLALLLPRLMPAAEVGTFFLAQVAIGIGAVAAQAGLTYIVPAAVGEALTRRDGTLAGALCRAALRLCLLASLAVCVTGVLAAVLWPARSAASLGFDRSTVAVVIGIVPFAALGAVVAEMHRARGAIALASVLPNAQGVAVAAVAVAAFLLGARPGPLSLLAAGLAGVAVAAALGFATVGRHLDLRATSDDPRAGLAGLFAIASPILLTNLGAVGVALADQTIAGVVGGAVDAAHYGLGLRLSSLLALPLGVVNVTLTPRIVSLWTEGQRQGLQRLLTVTATAASAAALLGLLAVVGLRFVGGPAIWDASYAPALTIGVILGLGQVLQACGGSSGHLLMLLGHQQAFMRVSLTVGAIAVVLGIAGMATWGITGLAAVMAMASAGQTLACVVLARRRLGLATWPRKPQDELAIMAR